MTKPSKELKLGEMHVCKRMAVLLSKLQSYKKNFASKNKK